MSRRRDAVEAVLGQKIALQELDAVLDSTSGHRRGACKYQHVVYSRLSQARKVSIEGCQGRKCSDGHMRDREHTGV